MAGTVTKIIITGLVLLVSGLTSIGTAGISGVAGIVIILALWVPDALEEAEGVL